MSGLKRPILVCVYAAALLGCGAAESPSDSEGESLTVVNCGNVDLDAATAVSGYEGRSAAPKVGVQGSYAEALRASLVFWEGQESGRLSQGNRLDWRGPAHLDDGADIGLDVSGGWYDAGDHWKGNASMAQGASMLAWSIIAYPQAYTRTGQLDHALNSLDYIADYFDRSIDDPAPNDPSDFSNYRVVIDVGGKNNNAPAPGVHSVWCAPEVTNGFTVRESLVVNKDVPGADVAGGMAAAMAAAAIVFHRYCDSPRAAELYRRAAKLLDFGLTYRSGDSERSLRPNGRIATGGMRRNDRSPLVWGAVWMHRASVALDADGYSGGYLDHARAVMDEDFEGFSLWWKDFGADYRHGAMLAWLEAGAGADEARLEQAVREHLRRWDEADTTARVETDRFSVSPEGLKVRQVYNGTFTSHRVLNQAALAAIFADWSDDPADDRYFDFAKSQLDYFLGANEEDLSYMIGFGQRWPDLYHHRSAHGPWAGFENFRLDGPVFLPRMRHTLYGTLLPGPDGAGVYDPEPFETVHTEPTLGGNAGLQVTLAAMTAHAAEASPLNEPFPPPDPRNDSLDPTNTDREFFVEASLLENGAQGVRLHVLLNNRSAWPPRVSDGLSLRYFFSPDNGASLQDYSAEVVSDQGGQLVGVKEHASGAYYAEVRFEGQIWPNQKGNEEYYRREAFVTIDASSADLWSIENDWSIEGLDQQRRIGPRIAVYEDGTLVGGEEP